MQRASLTYSLLLSLYHGRASVVELLDEESCAQLRVETSVFSYIERFLERTAPRHLFLTGNAGDGKTFAAKTSLPSARPGFCIVHDASAVWQHGHDPLSALAAQLLDALSEGQRLVIAINRGQLERLMTYVRSHFPHSELDRLITSAIEQLQLRDVWREDASDEIAVIDLGLWDTLHDEILTTMLERVANAEADVALAAPTLRAFEDAKMALQNPELRARIKATLQSTRTLGQHTTMRQLWAALSYLMTGGRRPDDDTPTSVRDVIGARLFDEEAQSELLERVRLIFDPALLPTPQLAIALLSKELPPLLRDVVTLEQRLEDRAAQGRQLVRILWAHGGLSEAPSLSSDFELHVKKLKAQQPGWHPIKTSAQMLLSGAYRQAGLWCEGEDFPAWQRLCYDASRIDDAAAVAAGSVDLDKFEFCLPRPAPAAVAALGDAWRSPYLWLRYGVEGAPLRLEPHMLNVLRANKGSLSRTERALLIRWLATLSSNAHRRETVRISKDPTTKPIALLRDELTGELRLSR